VIVYHPDPLELLIHDPKIKTTTIKLPSGGHILAEVCDFNRLRVISINSTDPMDYMDTDFQPGSFIDIEARPYK
jgi:hypothetical protein